MTERQTRTHDRTRCPRHDSSHVAHHNASRTDCTCARPAAADPLAALERARRLAFEAQEAERWDGLA